MGGGARRGNVIDTLEKNNKNMDIELISDEKVNFDLVRWFFLKCLILNLNVVLSFPALSFGFPVFKTYFMFDVSLKLLFF